MAVKHKRWFVVDTHDSKHILNLCYAEDKIDVQDRFSCRDNKFKVVPLTYGKARELFGTIKSFGDGRTAFVYGGLNILVGDRRIFITVT